MSTASSHAREVDVTYDDNIVRRFVFASVGWGIVGMLVGVIIALQLAFHQFNLLPELSFGRLRPLHTNAVIFAFVGNMMFAGVYYSTQRLLRVRAVDWLSSLHFYGWQLIIVSAALTLPFGFTQGKEYAELEWPIDIAVVIIWVTFAANFFVMLARRREKHLYVAIWFYISTIITIAVLYIVNNLAIPHAAFESTSVFAGVQDALVQWWYGHNAVAFFLTTPILGIMYYFLPKAVDRPVYSYRLSIIHFWALVFMYIWAGPHHLLYTALPDWAQSMGMVFSLMLWAPSWGGMLNGLLTLRGAWHKLRTDPVVKFLIAGVTFYGMSTFEGPLLSIKAVSSLAHYTDWIIGHVHSGALGWNGFMAAGIFYWLVPRLFGTKLKSEAAANAHFWLGTLGILLYTVSMWVSGITQGLMWRAMTPDGALAVPNFVDTVLALRPMYYTRIVGGSLYFVGFLLMAWNLIATARSGKAVDVTVKAVDLVRDPREPGLLTVLTRMPILLTVFGIGLTVAFFVADMTGVLIIGSALLFVVLALAFHMAKSRDKKNETAGAAHSPQLTHRLLEGKSMVFIVLTLLAVLVGGVVELVPTIVSDKAVPITGKVQVPYSPLQLMGRDIYKAEGCNVCHSQMIRPLIAEKLRYGDPSTAGEFIYDHNFMWGSKRTGPDLQRVGPKYQALWHYNHLMNPRSLVAGSNMPPYSHLARRRVDLDHLEGRVKALQLLGVPYADAQIESADASAEAEGMRIVTELKGQGVDVEWNSKMVALISYLLVLGNNHIDQGAGVVAPAAAPNPAP